MINATWRKHISVWRNRLYLYPPADALPHTRMFWVATGIVTFLALLFSAYFIFYLTGRHDAYLTHAEDLGIMDQAIWNTVHGNMLHQTICNIVNDTNCSSLNGLSRFAIHFEPILFPISLLYLIWPDPKTLLVLQTLVVASGAFPAFWLARLRLRSEWAGIAIALLYLLYPAQQYALVNDFHAVTFTAAFLLFTLYFMYTRRTVWLFVFVILAMACKEEIPLVIAVYGLWSMLFQRRWRSGLALVLLATAWLALFLLVVRLSSPTGHPLLASRYSYLGSGPLQIVKTVVLHPVSLVNQHILEHSHLFYLRVLLTPAGYFPLLAPWVLILALPSLALNLLSTDPNTYSGFFQYNAEIVPVLIFSTIEAFVLIVWLVQWMITSIRQRREKSGKSENFSPRTSLLNRWAHSGLLVVLLIYVLFNAVRANALNSNVPFGQGFSWPQTTVHTELAQQFIDMIPSTASVSAQSDLAPHVSHRPNIYLFPYADDDADYIFLDVTGNIYPSYDSSYYIHAVKKVLLGGNYGIVDAQDGYLLLKRGLPAPGVSPYSPTPDSNDIDFLLPNLPDSFCSFIRISPQQVLHPIQTTFTSMNSTDNIMNLVGYNVAAANPFSLSGSNLQVSTYWQVNAPTKMPLQVALFMIDTSGGEQFVSSDFPAFTWCPTNTSKPGTTLQLTSRLVNIPKSPLGLAHVSMALLPLTQQYSKIMNVQDRLTLHVLNAPSTVVPTSGTNGLQLATITLIP